MLSADLRRFRLHRDDYDMLLANAYMAAMLDELEIPFLDVTETLRMQHEGGELTFFKINIHLTPAGHRIVANAFMDMLESMEPRMRHD